MAAAARAYHGRRNMAFTAQREEEKETGLPPAGGTPVMVQHFCASGFCRFHDPQGRKSFASASKLLCNSGLYVAYNHAGPYVLVLAEAVQTAKRVNRNTHFLCDGSQCFAVLYLVVNTLGRACSVLYSCIFGFLFIFSDLAIHLITCITVRGSALRRRGAFQSEDANRCCGLCFHPVRWVRLHVPPDFR